MVKNMTKNLKNTGVLFGLIILGVLFVGLSVAQEKTGIAKLDKIVIAAATAQGKIELEMDAQYEKMKPKEFDEWRTKNMQRGGFKYFDELYQYGLKNLDNKSGFEALFLALEVSNDNEKEIYEIQEHLYKNYLNTPEYVYVLSNILMGTTVGYKAKTNSLSTDSLSKRVVKLLTRAERNATNSIVKNFSRYALASHLVDGLAGLEMKDIDIIRESTRQLAALLEAVIEETKDKPIALSSPDTLRVLALYNKNLTIAMGEKIEPSPENDKVIYLGEIAKRILKRSKSLTVGLYIPPTIGKDLEGNPHTLAQYKGRVLLMDFWATWCGPCVAQMPHLLELRKKFAGRPFAILGVSGDDAAEEAAEFVEDKGYTWDHWHSNFDEGLMNDWGITDLPTVLLIDHTGRLVIVDPLSEELESRLVELISAAEQSAKK
jgi:thiol-disulfide isomerase/thioredoxin